MALSTGTFPYDIANLLGGAARVLYTDDLTEPVPADLTGIIDVETPYTAQTGWIDLGATKESATYGREISEEGYEIQNVNGDVLSEITDIAHTMEVSVAEIAPAQLAVIEVSSAGVGTIAGAAGKSAQKSVKFGSFASVPRRRVAFIAQRNVGSGIVTESGGVERGGFVGVVLYNVAVAADSAEVEFDKGNLAECPVSFTAFPETTEDAGEEYGTWLFENLGQTIA